MKETRPEPKQRLLNDLLPYESGTESADPAKQRALAAFRRASQRRRLTRISRLAAVLLVLTVGGFFLRLQLVKNRASDRSELALAKPPRPEAAENATPTRLQSLTDEQLLASFPPNVCYLAEVDGRKILVFADSNDRKKYLH